MNNNEVINNTNQIGTPVQPNNYSPTIGTQPVIQQPSTVPITQPTNQPAVISIESIVPNASNYQEQIPVTIQATPHAQQEQPISSNEPVLIPITEPPKQQEATQNKQKKSKLPFVLFLVILLLVAYIVYSTKTNQSNINELIYKCSPINSSKDTINLDINSTLVQRLYGIVKTNIREDVAQTEFDNTYKAYLVLRQMNKSSIYESNCNLFDISGMEPYKCEGIHNFNPTAFSEEDYVLKWKEIFGENTTPYLGNIKLKNECIGGYQYIAGRHEFVEGYCDKQSATTYKVNKSIKSATSTRNSIMITEEVRYKENEGMTLPNYLKNGYYIYTFRLDINYNYVLVSKEYQSKY